MTNQSRKDFEAWFTRLPYGDPPPIEVWQAATEAERERCAKVCEANLHNDDGEWFAAAIRQGGDV